MLKDKQLRWKPHFVIENGFILVNEALPVGTINRVVAGLFVKRLKNYPMSA